MWTIYLLDLLSSKGSDSLNWRSNPDPPQCPPSSSPQLSSRQYHPSHVECATYLHDGTLSQRNLFPVKVVLWLKLSLVVVVVFQVPYCHRSFETTFIAIRKAIVTNSCSHLRTLLFKFYFCTQNYRSHFSLHCKFIWFVDVCECGILLALHCCYVHV